MGSEGFAAMLGVIAPIIISFLKDAKWSMGTKMSLTVAVCVLLGALSVYAAGGVELNSVESYIGAAATVFTVATVMYNTYFKNTELNSELTKALYEPKEPLK
jgi:biotin transporter BioY